MSDQLMPINQVTKVHSHKCTSLTYTRIHNIHFKLLQFVLQFFRFPQSYKITKLIWDVARTFFNQQPNEL